MGEKLKG